MAVSTWVLVALALIGIYVFVKANPGFRYGKIWTYLLGALIIFLFVSLAIVLTLPAADLSTLDGIAGTTKLYLSWLSNFVENTATITGNVVSADWGVSNSTR